LARIEGKKQKSEANSQTPGRPPFYDKYKDYNLIMWQKTTGVMMNRRAKEPRADMPPTKKLRYGELGALEHWRRGLVGAVQDWAVDVLLRFTPSRRHGRRAAVLTAPVPKRYKMHKDIDSEIRGALLVMMFVIYFY